MAKQSVYFTMESGADRHGVKEIKKELDALPGVLCVSESPYDTRVAVDYDDTGVNRQQIEEQLTAMGFRVITSQHDEHRM